jgi:prevent-host-death family protein
MLPGRFFSVAATILVLAVDLSSVAATTESTVSLDRRVASGHSDHKEVTMDGSTPLTVGVRELKTRLGKYLDLVQRGRTLVITDRGRPIAELRALSRSAQDPDARLEELASLGRLTRPTSGEWPVFEPLVSPGPSLTDSIVEGRKDRC